MEKPASLRAAIAAAEGDDLHACLLGGRNGAQYIPGITAGAERQQYIAMMPQSSDLAGKYLFKMIVVGDRGEGGDIRG